MSTRHIYLTTFAAIAVMVAVFTATVVRMADAVEAPSYTVRTSSCSPLP